MKNTCRFVLGFALVLQLCAIGSAQTLADIAREARAKRQSSTSRVITGASKVVSNDAEDMSVVRSLMARDAFTDLDAEANRLRTSKSRAADGAWNLFVFYETAANPVAGDSAGSTEWSQHIAKLQKWVATSPQSVTARIALAEAYRLLGWKARGGGFANTVSEAGWQQFGNMSEKAFKTLAEADALPAKCPHWYFVMLELARDQGLRPDQTRKLFERAIAFEPAYYHYYREYAYNLLPKWNGEPGDAEKFADESYRRIGGTQGAFVYFEIATVLYCMCSDGQAKPTLSWPVIQEGFAEIESHYGGTTLKLNRFAMLAFLYRDRDVARRVLERLNERWEPTVWRRLDTFNSARMWAGLTSL